MQCLELMNKVANKERVVIKVKAVFPMVLGFTLALAAGCGQENDGDHMAANGVQSHGCSSLNDQAMRQGVEPNQTGNVAAESCAPHGRALELTTTVPSPTPPPPLPGPGTTGLPGPGTTGLPGPGTTGLPGTGTTMP